MVLGLVPALSSAEICDSAWDSLMEDLLGMD